MEPILDTFNKVLAHCVKVKASDLHLCSGTPWKYRLNGHIQAIKLKTLEVSECVTIAKHIIANSNLIPTADIDRTVDTLRDMDCSYAIPGLARFRVNIAKQRGSLALVLRVVPIVIPTIEELGLPPVIRDIALEERGLILVTGVTGSGKSTTLASMLHTINMTKPCKIVTIEDPIEYLHRENKASIIQRELGADTESFPVALRAALRQDPDIILVGEMRDTVTIETALKAAETGHLVMSTLHTTDAPKTINRIISAFDLSEQQAVRIRLAEAIRAVISQQLLRRKDGVSRVAVLEIMRNTLTIKDCIQNPEKSGSIKDYMGTGREQYGMQTFDQHLMEIYLQGIIDLETAKAAATSASDFERNVSIG
jgi:twitching motility protein PilT